MILPFLSDKKIESFSTKTKKIIDKDTEGYNINLSLIDWVKIRLRNKKINNKKLKNSDYIIINDGSHGFGLETYYIKPVSQITQLKKMFNNISIYSVNSGQKINNNYSSIKRDPWCYYFCMDSNE